MKKKIYTLACALTLAAAATAQEALTLDECVSLALSNSEKLRAARIDVEISAEQRKEARTNYFPSVSAAGVGLIAKSPLIEMEMMGVPVEMIDNGVVASVTATQPIFAGGRIVNGNRLADVGEEVSRLQMSMAEDDVRLTAETYYWQIVLLQEKLNTISRVEAQIDTAARDAEAAVEAGLRNRNDLLQVRLKQNEMRSMRVQAENGLSIMTDLLGQYIGRAADSIVIASPVSDELPTPPDGLRVDEQQALAGTNEYQLLGKQVEASRLQCKTATGKNLPTVAVGGSYVFHNLMDKSTNNLVGTLTVSVPLTDWWGGSHSMKRQKLQLRKAESEQRDKGELIVISIRKAWNDVSEAYEQLTIAQSSIEQSQENLRLSTDYYQAGTVAMSDLLDAQTLYQQSRDQYVEAYTRYAVRLRDYLQKTGRR